MTLVDWVLVVLIIIVIIALLIFLFIQIDFNNKQSTFGDALRIQNGTSSASTDIFQIDGNTIYVARSASPLILTLNKGMIQRQGLRVFIKNNMASSNAITLKAGSITFDTGQLDATISAGQTAILMATNDSGDWLRLQ